jgi:hypothetical protein
MRVIQKYKQFILSIAVLVGVFGVMFAPATVHAAPIALPTTFAADCPDIKDPDTAVKELNKKKLDGGTCIIQRYVNPFIRFLTAVAGVAAVFSIVVGGIMYSSAGGDPSKVAAARSRIAQAVIAVLAFIFLLAFLNWVVPGGISGTGK